jgi:syntaxin 5
VPEPGGGTWASGGGGGGDFSPWNDEPNTPEALRQPAQQQHFWTPRTQQHREEEVSALTSTLAEIGSMYQRFSSIVAEQGEMLERIDTNTNVSLDNIETAHGQIVKFEKFARSNRALILKSFGVLFFVIVLWGTLK